MRKFYFMKDELRNYYENEGKSDYQSKLYQSRDHVHNRLKSEVIRMILKHIKESYYFLDAGCAEGLYPKIISSHSKIICGLDISKRKIRRGHMKLKDIKNLFLFIGDVENIPFKKGFDMIISIETLEHIPNINKVLLGFKRILNKNSILILSVPTEKNGFFASKRSNSWHKSGHLHIFSRKNIVSLLMENGFSVEKKIVIDVLGSEMRNMIGKIIRLGKNKSKLKNQGKNNFKMDLSYGYKFRYKLDKLLSKIPFINERGNYCIFVCRNNGN